MNIEERQNLFDSLETDSNMADDEPMNLDLAFMPHLIGSEGVDHSHAGGEADLMAEIAKEMAIRQGISSYGMLLSNSILSYLLLALQSSQRHQTPN
jgi:hypothetical protein